MTQTASILLAVLATGGAVAVYILMRREVRKLERIGYDYYMRADNLAVQVASLKKAVAVQANAAGYYGGRAADLEDRLRKIEQARHLSAKHARAVQMEKRRAIIHAQAEPIRRQTAEKEAA